MIEKAFVPQVIREHQVWSSGYEYEENENKRKRGKLCLVATKNKETRKLKKNYCFMGKEGNIIIVEQVKFMI